MIMYGLREGKGSHPALNDALASHSVFNHPGGKRRCYSVPERIPLIIYIKEIQQPRRLLKRLTPGQKLPFAFSKP